MSRRDVTTGRRRATLTRHDHDTTRHDDWASSRDAHPTRQRHNHDTTRRLGIVARRSPDTTTTRHDDWASSREAHPTRPRWHDTTTGHRRTTLARHDHDTTRRLGVVARRSPDTTTTTTINDYALPLYIREITWQTAIIFLLTLRVHGWCVRVVYRSEMHAVVAAARVMRWHNAAVAAQHVCHGGVSRGWRRVAIPTCSAAVVTWPTRRGARRDDVVM